MIVHAERRPERMSVDIRITQRTADKVLAMIGHDEWVDVPPGSEVPVFANLPEEVYNQLVQQGEPTSRELARADDMVKDARAIRDRLLTMIEEGGR